MSDSKDFDSFWLEKGQELVKNTFANLNKHLTNYSVYLKFLMGFYLVSGLTTTAFYQTDNEVVYLLFIVPTALVYWAIHKISIGQNVQLETLDLRSPLKINEAYCRLVLGLKKDIVKARNWTTIATLAVLIGGSFAIYGLNEEKQENLTELKAELKTVKEVLKTEKGKQEKVDIEIKKAFIKSQMFQVTRDKKDNKVIVEAKFAEDKTVEIKVIDLKQDTLIKIINVPKFNDYKMEIEDVKKLLDVKIKDKMETNK